MVLTRNFEIYKYFQADKFCNPNDFIFDTTTIFNSIFNGSTLSTTQDNLNNNIQILKIFISNHYIINKEKNDFKADNKKFYGYILNHTILKLVLRKYAFDTNELNYQHYFNTIHLNNHNIGSKDYEKNFNVTMFKCCLIIYRKLSLLLTKMGIKNVENIYSIYAFTQNVLENLKTLKLLNQKNVESFYIFFVNKSLSYNLFEKIQEKKMNINLTENTEQNSDYDIIYNIIDNCVSEKTFLGDFSISDLHKTELGNVNEKDMNFNILTILITTGIKTILTSVASHMKPTEYINYLSEVMFNLNMQPDLIVNSEFYYDRNPINNSNINNDETYRTVDSTNTISSRAGISNYISKCTNKIINESNYSKVTNFFSKNNTTLFFFEYSSIKFQTIIRKWSCYFYL